MDSSLSAPAAEPVAEPLVIMGAGLVGTLLALYLTRRGHPVHLYERLPDPRKAGLREARSINLALSDRGWRGLAGVGITDDIRKVGIPMYRRVMHDQRGQLTYQPYGQEGQAIFSVSRDSLNRTLLDLAEAKENVEITFGQKLTQLDLPGRRLHLRDVASAREYDVPYQRLFGVDGAWSAVRGAMQRLDRADYSQQYLEYGYKELTIAAGPGGTWQLEKNALHIWPRGNYLMIALPNLDGSFNATLFFPYEGPLSFDSLRTPEEVEKFFGEIFPDVVPLMPELDTEFFDHPTGSLVTIRCWPWSYQDSVLLLGDAAHAIVPFYGQGMNAGFEDCTVLDRLLDELGEENWGEVLDQFERLRKPNTDAMAELALYNFVEMRDHVADPRFLLQKRIESKIAAQFPGQWLPLYSRVTFSPDTPYAEAWAAGQRQEAIMQRLMPHIQTEDDFEKPEVQALVQQELAGK
jgi:kynurenine 3-monooxygenase